MILLTATAFSASVLTMEIHLNNELQAFVNGKLKLGYASASEFVEEALQSIKTLDELNVDFLKAEVQEGIDSADKHGCENGELVMARLLAKINNQNL